MNQADEDTLVAKLTMDRGIVPGFIGEGNDQMIRLAIRAAVAAERERACEACFSIGKDIVCPEECAAAIRRGE